MRNRNLARALVCAIAVVASSCSSPGKDENASDVSPPGTVQDAALDTTATTADDAAAGRTTTSKGSWQGTVDGTDALATFYRNA